MKYKNQTNVSGLKVSDIVSMSPGQIAEMSDSDLRRLVGRLVSAGNKRLRTFERNNEKSPAYRQAMEGGGHFSTKGKDRGQLIQEYNRARFFFKDETSSVKEWKNLKKTVETHFHSGGGDEKDVDMGEAFAIYDKLHRIDPTTFNRENKYKIVAIIAQMMSRGEATSFDTIVTELRTRLEQVEAEREAVNNEFDVAAGLSGFFD